MNGPRRGLAALLTEPRYEGLNIAMTVIAVFTLPVTALFAHAFAPGHVEVWLDIAMTVEVVATCFFLFDVAVGFAARGLRYAGSSSFAVNVLAVAALVAELAFGVVGLANARILRILRPVRHVDHLGLLVRGGARDSVLGAEALGRMNDADTWYALVLLALMAVLGQFSPGLYASADDALLEIAVYAGFAVAVRWKAQRNRAQVEGVLVDRLRDANRRVMERMHEIPGLEDADRLVAERAIAMRSTDARVSEIEILVEAIGLIIRNLRRFISRRAFAEAKGEEVLSPERPVALMFTDVEGFSRVTESMHQHVIPVLQRYLGDMSQGVLDHQGDVDKFIGDAVFAYFDDRADPSNASNLALDAALALHVQCDMLAETSAEWAALFDGDPSWPSFKHFRTRIGLHRGFVVAGPIGSEHRADSTLVGDDVNLCARLEDLCKKYGTYCLLSDAFYADLSSARQARCRFIDRVTVAGREESPLDLYTVDARTLPDSFLEVFQAGVHAYLHGDWEAAHAHFTTGQERLRLADRPADGVTEALLRRIESNRLFWNNAVDHLHTRAPTLVTVPMVRALLAARDRTPFQAPVTWRGFWRHDK